MADFRKLVACERSRVEQVNGLTLKRGVIASAALQDWLDEIRRDRQRVNAHLQSASKTKNTK